MRELLLMLALAIATAGGCTNDYGQFRFPPESGGGAPGSEGGSTATGGDAATGGDTATGGDAATGGAAAASAAGGTGGGV